MGEIFCADRHRARPGSRVEGPGRAVREGRAAAGALRARGAGRGAALGDAQHRHDLRRHRARGPADHRHGVPRRAARSRRRSRGTPCPPSQALAWLEEAAGGARCGARRRNRAPRREAREPPARRAGPRARRRLRDRERGGARLAHADRDDPRHRRLPVARAGDAASGATAASDRYALAVVAWELLTGRRPFAAQVADDGSAAHVQGADPVGPRREPEPAARAGSVFERALAKDPARPLPDGGRVRRRPAPRARRRGRRHLGRATRRRPQRTPVVPAASAADVAARVPALLALLLLGAGVALALALVDRSRRGGTAQTRTLVRGAHGPSRRSRPHPRPRRPPPSTPATAVARRRSAEQRRLREAAGGRLRRCAPAARAGGAEA